MTGNVTENSPMRTSPPFAWSVKMKPKTTLAIKVRKNSPALLAKRNPFRLIAGVAQIGRDASGGLVTRQGIRRDQARRAISTALVPPKANEFDMTAVNASI